MITNEHIELFLAQAHRYGDAKLMLCSSGNLSWRIGEEALISGTGSWVPTLAKEKVSICNIASGMPANGVKPSMESTFHLGVLRERPDVNVVLHFQSEYATAISCMKNKPTNFNVTAEIPCHVGSEIPVIPYYRPGSPELAKAVVEAMLNHNSVLLTNHGQVVCGKDFDQVYERATFFEMACRIIVQSGGDYSVLTPEEIAACDCIIIAADKDVAMARFDGKPLISTKVSDGINKAQELIERALSGNAPVYHSKGGATEEGGASADGDTIGRKIYKSLMNGVSHMLPFVIGGGILIALSFLVDGANAGTAAFGSGTPLAKFFNTVGNTAFGMMFPILAGYIAMAIGDRPALMPGIVGGLLAKAGTSVFLAEDAWISSGFFGALIAGFAAGYLMIGLKKLFDKLPKTLEGTKPVLLYPFFGILIMAAFMIFIVNPPVGAFNTWLNNVLSGMGESSKMLLGAVLAGMMSIDFGGPFNKAAYVFGTASIASGQFDIMASVMIGGMVPPIAIALATTFFKNRFTKSEQQTSITNYIMGLSFITEGAIPFAASDPLRIIPPCIVGSAIAGALSMMFGCGSRAPHGGIFVIGIIDNPLMFLIALVVGAVVAMAGIVLLKKPLKAE